MDLSAGTLEANDDLNALLERVEKGESITITRHGVPVARVVPATSTLEQRREAIESWKRLRVGNNLGSDLTIRDLIDEGRR